MAEKKGKSIYLTINEQSIITNALSILIQSHQIKYEKEIKDHENDRRNIDDWYLDQMLEVRRLLDDKFSSE